MSEIKEERTMQLRKGDKVIMTAEGWDICDNAEFHRELYKQADCTVVYFEGNVPKKQIVVRTYKTPQIDDEVVTPNAESAKQVTFEHSNHKKHRKFKLFGNGN